MLGAAPLAEADGVILFSGLATSPDIANAGDYIFRTSMNDAQLGIDAGNVMWAGRYSQSGDHLRDHRLCRGRAPQPSVAQFEKRGGTVVAVGALRFRYHRLQDPAYEADRREPRCPAPGRPIRIFSGGTIIKQVRELGYEGQIYADIVPVGGHGA